MPGVAFLIAFFTGLASGFAISYCDCWFMKYKNIVPHRLLSAGVNLKQKKKKICGGYLLTDNKSLTDKATRAESIACSLFVFYKHVESNGFFLITFFK